ncbi:MAG: hypothetical protein ACPG6T_07080 [Paracoccaceae bacterium]|jgi:hypothetical protein
MLLGNVYKDPVTYRGVDTSSLAGVTEASRQPNILTDIQMGLGIIPEDSSYRARTERTKLRNKMMEQNQSRDRDRPSKPKGPSKKELELKKRREEGQAARKKFEKEKGERVSALRKRYMTLLNLA